ncbi:hypothetical protein FQR65_LT20102 [Abscondita terminalis]|nr:hypothetical protein FQR65_LT20102 [Abscondita terminalis]
MTKSELEQFVKNYIQAWSTTDAGKRKQLMEKVYSASATFYANEPGDDTVMHHGMDRIYENITKVNQRLTIENGLVTECTHYCENHNTLRSLYMVGLAIPIGGTIRKSISMIRYKNCPDRFRDMESDKSRQNWTSKPNIADDIKTVVQHIKSSEIFC